MVTDDCCRAHAQYERDCSHDLYTMKENSDTAKLVLNMTLQKGDPISQLRLFIFFFGQYSLWGENKKQSKKLSSICPQNVQYMYFNKVPMRHDVTVRTWTKIPYYTSVWATVINIDRALFLGSSIVAITRWWATYTIVRL